MARRDPYGLVPELITKTALSLRGLSTGRSGFVGRRKSELGRDWGNCSGRKLASRFLASALITATDGNVLIYMRWSTALVAGCIAGM